MPRLWKNRLAHAARGLRFRRGAAALCLALCLLSGSAQATPEETINEDQKLLEKMRDEVSLCAKHSDRQRRIGCYDELATELGYFIPENIVTLDKSVATFGAWRVDARERAGQRTYYLSVRPNAPVFTKQGYERHPELVVSCKVGGGSELYMDWKAPLARTDMRPKSSTQSMYVGYRFDAGETEPAMWELSADTYAIFSKRPLEFARLMIGKSILVLEVTPAFDQFHKLTFPIEHAEEGLKYLAWECFN